MGAQKKRREVWRNARVPFRVFGDAARRETFPPQRRPLGIRGSSRVPSPPKYRGYWFHDPALPLAVSPALRFSLDEPRGLQLSNPCTLSASSAFLQSLAQRVLAGRPQSASSSHGLSRPCSTLGIGGPLSRGLPSLATFRPQGLVTLSAAYSLRAPAGSLSHRRRSWDLTLRSFLLSAGIRHVSGAEGPTCRFSRRFSRRRSGRPAQRAAAPGLQPCRESLAADT
jgi:hypothetical protein